MGRSSKKKAGYKKRFKKSEDTPIPVIIKELPKSRFKIFGIAIWKVIAGILVLIGGLATLEPVRDLFLTPHEKYEKETFVEGDLKLPKLPSKLFKYYDPVELKKITTKGVFDTLPTIKGILIKDFEKLNIKLFIGGEMELWAPNQYYDGIEVFGALFKECYQSQLILGVKDDRLYVSVEFKDLQKEETIGFIEFNHWKLYKNNMLDFYNDDQKLMVKDKQNNIVFSITYVESTDQQQNPTISIEGYFISPTSVLVLRTPFPNIRPPHNLCYFKKDNKWKQKALMAIQTIKTRF